MSYRLSLFHLKSSHLKSSHLKGSHLNDQQFNGFLSSSQQDIGDLSHRQDRTGTADIPLYLYVGFWCVVLVLASPLQVRADRAGDQLLQKCFVAESRATTLEANFSHQFVENGEARTQTGTIQLKKPNMAHIVVKGSKQTNDVVINSDGKKFLTFSLADKAYASEPADMTGSNVARNNITETKIFFFPDYLNRLRVAAKDVRIRGEVTIGDTPCRILEFYGMKQEIRLYIGSDGILRGIRVQGLLDKDKEGGGYANPGSQQIRNENHLTNVRVDGAVQPAAFLWSPPKGARTVQEVRASEAANEAAMAQGRQAISLIPVGKTVPDFTLPMANGGKVTLSTEYRKNKVTLLNFWAAFCGPCRAELPHLSEMAAKWKAQGFDVLTVNTAGDTAPAIEKIFKDQKIDLRSAMDNGPVSSKFGIQAIPTNYLIDSTGKILATFEGFDESGIRQVLAKMGIQ